MTLQELPITNLPAGRVHAQVIVCGDPARADRIAEQLDGAALLSHKREYRAHNGTYRGTPITVCSHGIGAAGAAIAFEELIVAGARTIIRVGTCGGLQSDVQPGHLAIATAAVQNTGYGREVVPEGYPAVASAAATLALQQAVESSGRVARTGIVLSRDSFYPGVDLATAPNYRVMSSANVLAVEMECAALFIVGSLRGARTAAILAVDGNVLEAVESVEGYKPGRDVVHQAVDAAILVALEALCHLA